MNSIEYLHNQNFTITRDDIGWLLVANKPPFYSIRYSSVDDMFQITIVSFRVMPKGIQYSISQGRLALKRAMAKTTNKQKIKPELSNII